MVQNSNFKAVVLINLFLVIGYIGVVGALNFFEFGMLKKVVPVVPPLLSRHAFPPPYVTNRPVYTPKPVKEVFQIEKNGKHPCNRECSKGEQPLNCYYHFEIEWYQSMSKACFNCPYNMSDCNRKDCVPVDGVSRSITVINRKFPGPSIEVCQYDRIIVDVKNELMAESTSIHWHGYHMRGTPYMDGVPFVTQCPITPFATFRYDFKAIHSGTHFYHSHSGVQRADGIAGTLIVRKPKSEDYHGDLYDYDSPDHVIILTDWTHDLNVGFFNDLMHAWGVRHHEFQPVLLVNGRGRSKNFRKIDTDEDLYIETPRFNVQKGKKYRFRIINAESLSCPIEVSVDNHNITVIASDGYDIQPITATSLVTFAGERYDFIIDANEEVGNYWIKFRGDGMDCIKEFAEAREMGVLHYEGASDGVPGKYPTWEESHREGLQLNPQNKGEEDENTICVSKMRSIASYDDSLKPKPDQTVYISYDFYGKDSAFHKPPYSFNQALKGANMEIPQLNHITMQLPASPLLIAKPPSENFCNSSNVNTTCVKNACHCHHVVSVKLNDVVEIIFVDNGQLLETNHPLHLHGHSFRVVAQRQIGESISLEKVKALNNAGLIKRNLQNAPIKDTIATPYRGYSVVRFKADNPGYWFIHCHIESHAETGMGLVLKIGEHSDMPPLPKGFPTCGDYIPE